MRTQLSTTWPMLPREQLDDAVSSFDDRNGVVLYGAPGVGKSRLADEVRARLDDAGRGSILWFSVVGSHAETAIPLSAVDGLLAAVDVTARTPRQIARMVHRSILDQAGGRRIALFVDDAHLLDGASAELLTNLCRLGDVWLLATSRSGHAQQPAIVSLWRDDVVARIDVPPFTVAEVRDLLWAALGGPVDSELVREVVRATDGNAMFVRELVRAGLAEQTIVQRHGTWVRDGASGPSERLVDLIDSELGRLSTDERAAIELIALAEPVSLALARPLIDDDVLDRLVVTGAVRIEDGLTPSRLSTRVLRLSHPIYAECVRSMISPGRRHALHRRLYGETGRSSHQTLSGFLRWTAWTLECGLDVDPADLVRAARAASALSQYDFAITVATAAIDRTDDTPTAVEALAIRARELRYLDRHQEALRDVDAAIVLLRETPTSLDERMAERILMIHELRAEIEQYGFDEPDRAIETIDRVYRPLVGREERSQHSRRHRMTRIARRGWAGDLADPLGVVAELTAGASSPGPWDLQAVAPTMLALTFTGRTREAAALAALYEATGAQSDATMPRVGAEIHLVSFFTHLVAGRLDDARRVGPDPRSASGTSRFGSALTYAGTGRLLAAEGRWVEADQHFQIARRMFEVRDPSGFLAWSLAGEAHCAMMIGEVDRARATCERIEHIPWRASRAFEADIRTQVTATLVGLGDCGAAGHAAALAVWAQEHGAALVELESLLLIANADAEIARAAGSATRARDLADRVDASLAAAMADHVEAVVIGDHDLQDAAARRLADLGRWMPRRPSFSFQLSRREAEIASLVAAGLTSPVIAERLHLSPRTVETHVARVFAKLGVNKRSQVADALRHHSV